MPATRPAIVVPDESTWLQWGEDVRRRGLRPTSSAIQATAMLVAAELPDALAEAAAAAWAQMPPGRQLVVLAGPQSGGIAAEEALARHAHHDDQGDDHAGHGEHGGHDHEHMMEVTGEPSADGLVMENIDFETGSLPPGLPAGLSLAVSLDGDVVCDVDIRATLRAEAGATIPDQLSATAWRIAAAVACEQAAGMEPDGPDQWRRLAAVELERAVSHLAWLHRLAVLLGWNELMDRARDGLLPLADLPSLLLAGGGLRSGQLESSLRAANEIASRFAGSRRLAVRARDRAVPAPGDPRVSSAGGPIARASGRSEDLRTRESAYAELGFSAETLDGGDARARAQVRMAEAEQSLRLAAAAVERMTGRAALPGDEPLFSTPAGAAVEGPRGVMLASEVEPGAPVIHAAPGAAAQRELAAASVRGAEWAAALLGIASFDLSPWEVAA